MATLEYPAMPRQPILLAAAGALHRHTSAIPIFLRLIPLPLVVIDAPPPENA
jgi:hypothetical protein